MVVDDEGAFDLLFRISKDLAFLPEPEGEEVFEFLIYAVTGITYVMEPHGD